MTTNFQQVLNDAARDRAVAELKLQSAMLSYYAIHIAGNVEEEPQARAQVHAIIDVLLDAEALKYHCLKRM